MADAAFIVGAGRTELGVLPQYDALELHARAAAAAMRDAGLEPADIDGVLTCGTLTQPYPMYSILVAERLGIDPKFCLTIQAGGASHIAGTMLAQRAIAAGQASRILVVCAEASLSGWGRDRTVEFMPQTVNRLEEERYGLLVPGLFALIAARYLHEYGLAEDANASIAVATRAHAGNNPGAFKRDPITVEDVMASPTVSSPLHRLDCSVICDGGGAVIVSGTPEGRAPLKVLGYGEGTAWMHPSQAPSLTDYSSMVDSISGAMGAAGVGVDDLDVACLYDCFTIAVAAQLESLGVCGPGEAGQYAAAHGFGANGGLLINPHGGLLSAGHPGYPGGMLHLVEAVDQLRGEGVGQSGQAAETALVTGLGGPFCNHASLVLGRH